jgi:hypothetical protein
MSYTIVILKADKALGDAAWNGELDSAINYARTYLTVHEAQRDDTGFIIFNEYGKRVVSIPEDCSAVRVATRE